MPERSGRVNKISLTMRERSHIVRVWRTRTPEPFQRPGGSRHTPTAEAVRMRLVAAFSLRPSAKEQKAVMNVLKAEKKIAVVSALVEGIGIRSIERLTGVHRDTIMRHGPRRRALPADHGRAHEGPPLPAGPG